MDCNCFCHDFQLRCKRCMSADCATQDSPAAIEAALRYRENAHRQRLAKTLNLRAFADVEEALAQAEERHQGD